MKKHAIIFQKLGKISVPVYREQFNAMLDDVKDNEFFQGVFSKPKKGKSCKQLGYLFSAVYPHFIAHYKETAQPLYQILILGESIDVETNMVSIDLYLKRLFCVYKSIPSFSKEHASTLDIKDYTDFLDRHSIERFQCHLPDPKKQ